MLAGALLACKKDDEGGAGSACKTDSDCKNGLLCESSACIPKAAAEKIRAAQTAASATPSATAAGGAGDAAAAEGAQGKSAPDDSAVPAIPEGRSDPPTVAEWGSAEEINTQEANSQPDKCEMKVVREWVRVSCRGEILSYEKMEGFGNKNADYFEMIQPGKLASFVVRMKKGKTQSVRICRADGRASLFVNWPGSKDRPTHIALGKGPKCGS
jgi:hypothetical protein